MNRHTMTDHAAQIRKQFILRRDAMGRAKYVAKRFWHGYGPHFVALIILYLFVSTLQYREEVAEERAAKEQAQRESAEAQSVKRADAITFVIVAKDFADLERQAKAIRNQAGDTAIHARAAQELTR